ncbi:MAG: DNA-processing protein DprA [Gammaproteobacteria bacterium]|nr:DNA-processing protein DprA [Gammaproteobacteria bacterium]
MQDARSDLSYDLALLRAPGVGGATFHHLLERFGSARAVFERRAAERSGLGLSAATLAYLKQPDWDAVQQDLAWLKQPGHHALSLNDARYPSLLRETAGAPPVLFVHGDAELLTHAQFAIVGSRNPTPQGAQNAEEFARYLAACGLVITSGLALGIDAAAHRGALKAGGCTVAVVGTGLDRVYPARHKALAHEIAAHGALVSEFPLGTPALPDNFPRRNRIISGLACGTLVVEAAAQSGSLITARLAAEQGREVFAIPGSIHNPLARGCHKLIRDGAKLVETAQDILEELGAELNGALAGHTMMRAAAAGPDGQGALTGEALKILECLSFDPTSTDILIERSGLTPETVSSMLLVLELHGYVAPLAGGLYSRVTKGN